jgi:hypothetical protein
MPEAQDNLYRPHLAIAVFCEKVLREADGVISLIRVVDRFIVAGATSEMEPQVLKFTLMLMFKAGFMRGKATIAVRPKSPAGAELPAMEFPVLFEGDDDRGLALSGEVNFPISEEGVYWFDVYVMQELVTRMPLRVVYQRVAFATGQD